MNDLKYDIVTAADRPDLMNLVTEVTAKAWPEFMLHDPVAALFTRLYADLPNQQFAFMESGTDRIIVLGNTVSLAWHYEPSELSDTGWDWAMQSGIDDHDAGRTPTVLCALQIVVAREFQGRGLSRTAVETMRSLARRMNLKSLIAPVRPSSKANHPLVPMEEYIHWKDDNGLPSDPWMRVHARCGGQIVKTCHQAMKISGTVAEWEEWTGMRFPRSGKHIVPGALVPVDIDLEVDRGLYIEPNVWMHHPL
ncbi:MAG: hypothetical protein JSU74_14180 [Candidatus Zixiibacteriota bacterium]|nr:MAG: hypothetical protein JSU74_14180 [candidate division Zixibacteria bacterium]